MMLSQEFWNEHNCFVNMGEHYFTFNYDPSASCHDSVPLQIVYWEGKLNAFVFQHIARLDGSRSVAIGIHLTPDDVWHALGHDPTV
jgi:hypothetical protein